MGLQYIKIHIFFIVWVFLDAAPIQKTPDKSSKLNNLIRHLSVPSRTTHESISIQPAAGQHNLLHAFQNQCWKINHCSQHDNTVANSILVESPQKHLFHTLQTFSQDIFFLMCMCIYTSTLLDMTIFLPTVWKWEGEMWCMVIWSEGPPVVNIGSDRCVSLPSAHLNPAEKAAPSRVNVPETAAITVLGKGDEGWQVERHKQETELILCLPNPSDTCPNSDGTETKKKRGGARPNLFHSSASLSFSWLAPACLSTA